MGKNIKIKRKLVLGNGKVVDGILIGEKGGDVDAIFWKKRGKWVSTDKAEGRGKGVYPIKTLTPSPFVDIDVAKKKTKERGKK